MSAFLNERSPNSDQMGQALLFHRAHPALRKSVQVRAAWRKSQTRHAACCQRLAELSAELGIVIGPPCRSTTRAIVHPHSLLGLAEFRRNGAQDTRGILVKVGSDPQAALR
jgi:hypothetical protein